MASETLFQGYLWKRGHFVKSWRKRWFVVKGATVCYYETEEEASTGAKGAHLIAGVRDWPDDPLGWIMETLVDKPYYLKAETMDEKRVAFQAMQRAVEVSRLSNNHTGAGSSKGGGGKGGKAAEGGAAENPRVKVAVELCRQGLVNECVQALVEVSEQDRHSAEVWFHLGSAYLCQGDEDRAITCLRTAKEHDPDHADTCINLGVAYYIVDRLDDARAELERVLRRVTDASAANSLGLVLLAQGELDLAEHQFRQALSVESAFILALCNLGDVMMARHELEAAIDTYRQAVEVDDDDFDANLCLGRALVSNQSYVSATAHLRKACALNPESAESLSLFATALEAQGETVDAEKIRARLREMGIQDTSSSSAPGGGGGPESRGRTLQSAASVGHGISLSAARLQNASSSKHSIGSFSTATAAVRKLGDNFGNAIGIGSSASHAPSSSAATASTMTRGAGGNE